MSQRPNLNLGRFSPRRRCIRYKVRGISRKKSMGVMVGSSCRIRSRSWSLKILITKWLLRTFLQPTTTTKKRSPISPEIHLRHPKKYTGSLGKKIRLG